MTTQSKSEPAQSELAKTIQQAVYQATYDATSKLLSGSVNLPLTQIVEETPAEEPKPGEKPKKEPKIPGIPSGQIVVEPYLHKTNLKNDMGFRKAFHKVVSWAKSKKISDARLANLLGISPNTFYRIDEKAREGQDENITPKVANKFVRMYYQIKN